MYPVKVISKLGEKLRITLFDKFTSLGRGMEYSRQGNSKMAIRELEKAKIGSCNLESKLLFHTVLAECYLKIGEYDKAADQYRNATILSPENHILQDQIEQCHVMKEMFQQSTKLSLEEMQKPLPPQIQKENRQSLIPGAIAKEAQFKSRFNRHLVVASSAIIISLAILAFLHFNRTGSMVADSRNIKAAANPIGLKNVTTLHNKTSDPKVVTAGMGKRTAGRSSSKTSSRSLNKAPKREVGISPSKNNANRKVNYATVHPTDTIRFE